MVSSDEDGYPTMPKRRLIQTLLHHASLKSDAAGAVRTVDPNAFYKPVQRVASLTKSIIHRHLTVSPLCSLFGILLDVLRKTHLHRELMVDDAC